MQIKTSPTRMQLLLLKKRLDLAKRGHKLLKDKLDGLVIEFLNVKKEFLHTYESLTPSIRNAFQKSIIGVSLSLDNQSKIFEEEISDIDVQSIDKNIMGVRIKKYAISATDKPILILEGRSVEFYEAARNFKNLLPKLIDLATALNTLKKLSKQIYETKRRVNALEYVLIPELTKSVKGIKLKLEEAERSSRVVLLKMY